MSAVYAAAIYSERFIRPGLIGRKCRALIPVGVCLLHEDSLFQAYNLSWRSSKEDRRANIVADLPPLVSDSWFLYRNMLSGVAQFFSRIPSGDIVSSGSVDVLAIVRNLVQEAGVKGDYSYTTISQRISTAAAWLPESVYGAASDFLISYPQVKGTPFTREELEDMFMSHLLFSGRVTHIDNHDIAQAVRRMRMLNDTVNVVMRHEIARLQYSAKELNPEQADNVETYSS